MKAHAVCFLACCLLASCLTPRSDAPCDPATDRECAGRVTPARPDAGMMDAPGGPANPDGEGPGVQPEDPATDPGCQAGFHRCNGVCKDSRDPAHCGFACEPCPGIKGGDPTCDGRKCDVKCPAGTKACIAGGECIGLDQPCEDRCAAGEKPCGGKCFASSALPREKCDNSQDDDCDGQSDCADSDCANGTACGTNRVCSNGQCITACTPGGVCQTNPGNSQCIPGIQMCDSGGNQSCVDNGGPSCNSMQICQNGQCMGCATGEKPCNGRCQECCDGETKSGCSNNCGETGMQTCTGGRFGPCSAMNKACCNDGQCGRCQECANGTCRDQAAGQDKKNECGGRGCDGGSCRDCVPNGPVVCMDNDLKRCNASGSGYTTVTDCGGRGCTGTRCRICNANQAECSGPTFRRCNGDGTAYSTNMNCGNNGCDPDRLRCRECSGSGSACRDGGLATCDNGFWRTTSCSGSCLSKGGPPRCGCKIEKCKCMNVGTAEAPEWYLVTGCGTDGEVYNYNCDDGCSGGKCTGTNLSPNYIGCY